MCLCSVFIFQQMDALKICSRTWLFLAVPDCSVGHKLAKCDIQGKNIYWAAEERKSKLIGLNCLQFPKHCRGQRKDKSVINKPPPIQPQTVIIPHSSLVYFKFRISGPRPSLPPQNAQLVLFPAKPSLLNGSGLFRKLVCDRNLTSKLDTDDLLFKELLTEE